MPIEESESIVERKARELEERRNHELSPIFMELTRIANALDDLNDHFVSFLSRPAATTATAGVESSGQHDDLPLATCEKDNEGNYIWTIPEEAFSKPRKCKRCGHEPIYWVRSRKGKAVALEADGYSHFTKCGQDRSESANDVPF